MENKIVVIGKIVNTHGLKGEVKIYPNTDFIEERFQVGNQLYVNYQLQQIPVVIKSFRMHKGMPLITFEGFEDINLIEKYKQCEIIAEKNDEYLEDGEYYYSDIIGCRVIDEIHGDIGEIISIMETLAHDIIIVKTEHGETKIPYVNAFIKKEDIENKIFYVKLIKGMYDEN